MKPVRGRGRGRGRQWTDARQILKMKRVGQSRGAQSNRQFNSNILARTIRNKNDRPVWRKPRFDVRNQSGRSVWRKSNLDLDDSSSKRVMMQRGGRIIVTSKQNDGTVNDELDVEDKQIFADGRDITVTKVNYTQPTKGKNIFEHLSQIKKGTVLMEDDDDDLERLTLEDLPEKKKPTRFKSNIFTEPSVSLIPWPSHYVPPLPVTSRVQKHSHLLQTANTASHNDFSILVTNLHGEVTKEDVVELFSDIGTVTGVQLVQPGTALVTYSNKEEASWACDIYHNRLLDGQPMQCTLLSTASSTRPAGRITERLSPLVSTVTRRSSIPASALQNVFPQPSRSTSLADSSSTGRSVNFTVRVP